MEGDERDAVERVVGVGGGLALGVGLGEQVAGGVVGVVVVPVSGLACCVRLPRPFTV